MNLSSWRQNLFEFWHRPPSGYRPGLTLNQLRRDLAGLEFDGQGMARGTFRCLQRGLAFEVAECPQAQFLMHIVACQWSMRVPCAGPGQARITLRHTGAIRRQGVAARLQVGDSADWAPLLQRLCRDRQLLEVLLPLDFKRLELCRDERGWQVTLEHFGASEVVNRLPGMRRYIRLNTEQREALLGSFSHLQRLLGGY
ncbi:DUF3156 family protein [Pseudomonas sessilinigenes]|uniref:DUF3156 family protein n=1 Tax=Pseudomonas sessilinigenes TaxID=658629 RepID=A0ABX8MY05_9PSED|nr:DUF3156 family protein [Pseudomonas sessilinigenes]AZC24626.1 hypothetical protein C4K39_2952 [Pseudomonas sessilinigenes]QXH43553.1 DUF3156 family protein [Pseudomonas sessilinigenes]